jgi:hypothetical protein
MDWYKLGVKIIVLEMQDGISETGEYSSWSLNWSLLDCFLFRKRFEQQQKLLEEERKRRQFEEQKQKLRLLSSVKPKVIHSPSLPSP